MSSQPKEALSNNVQTSDEIVFRSALRLEAEGITRLQVVNADALTQFPISKLTGYSYNPRRDSFTVSTEEKGQVSHYTYQASKIRLIFRKKARTEIPLQIEEHTED